MKSHEAKYKDFSRQTGLRTQTERLQMKGFNKSVSQKAVQSIKSLEKESEKYYNTGSKDENIKLYLRDEKLRKYLKSDKVNKTIHKGRQEKHIKEAHNYIEGRSYITISIEQAQQLVNQYAGTGRIQRTRAMRFDNKESCKADRIIGVAVSNGIEYPTSSFKIHYSKAGTHIVPIREDVK